MRTKVAGDDGPAAKQDVSFRVFGAKIGSAKPLLFQWFRILFCICLIKGEPWSSLTSKRSSSWSNWFPRWIILLLRSRKRKVRRNDGGEVWIIIIYLFLLNSHCAILLLTCRRCIIISIITRDTTTFFLVGLRFLQRSICCCKEEVSQKIQDWFYRLMPSPGWSGQPSSMKDS